MSSRVPPKERPETLAMVWPVDGKWPTPSPAPGCTVQFGVARAEFEEVQAAAGWTVSPHQWHQLIAEMVPGTMVIAYDDGAPIAAGCAVKQDGDWVELAWVAVVVTHCGRGLGRLVCAELTRHLLGQGRTALFGSTQDTRLAALRLYRALGFHPLYRAEKVDRWRRVCAELDRPYMPVVWGWGITPDDKDI